MSEAETPPTALLQPLKVAIRVDASRVIGAGHVMRCLTLARALRHDGHDVVFVSRPAPGDLHTFLEDEHGFRVKKLPPSENDGSIGAFERSDARATINALAGHSVDWIAVDHYRLGSTWEMNVRTADRRVVAIDDFASRTHACDLIIDHNLVPADIYNDAVAHDVGLLLGPSYALVRPEFVSLSEHAGVGARPETVVVSFGSADAGGQTLRVLEALREVQPTPRKVIVLAGPENPDVAAIEEMAEEWSALEIHEFVPMPEAFLGSADLAIGAGGVSALERAAIGVPSIVMATAGNQVAPSKALANAGALLYLGEASDVDDAMLAAAIQTMHNPNLRASMRTRGRALVDGRGPQRIVRAMHKCAPVQVRRALPVDRDRILAWRNHGAVRHTAFDPSEISSSAHARWFEGVLTDPDRHLLVAELGGTAFGVVRYDVDRMDRSAEISIFLAPEVHGLGLGEAVLRATDAWLADHDPSIVRVDAKMLGSNERSHRVFASSGFQIRQTWFEFRREDYGSDDSERMEAMEVPREDDRD